MKFFCQWPRSRWVDPYKTDHQTRIQKASLDYSWVSARLTNARVFLKSNWISVTVDGWYVDRFSFTYSRDEFKMKSHSLKNVYHLYWIKKHFSIVTVALKCSNVGIGPSFLWRWLSGKHSCRTLRQNTWKKSWSYWLDSDFKPFPTHPGHISNRKFSDWWASNAQGSQRSEYQPQNKPVFFWVKKMLCNFIKRRRLFPFC
jgi:hypothetical protein